MLELAGKADWEAVSRLSRQVHDQHVSWRPDLFQTCDVSLPEAEFLDAIDDRLLYVARLHDQIVGYVHLNMVTMAGPRCVPRKVMILDSICVDRDFRGQGIGRAMLTDVRALAKAFRCKEVVLTVFPENDGAVAFYQKCGFLIRSIKMDMKV